MAEPGRPTELTEELTLKIRQFVLDGKLYKDIQGELNISPNTWDTWVYKDYEGFRAKLNEWKKERMIKKAERNLETFLELPDDVVLAEPQFMKIKQDTSKFVVERLNKDDYASRQENTGKGGKDLPTPILANLNVPTDNGNQEDSPASESDTGDTGGDLSEQDHLDTADTDRPGAEGREANSDQHSVGIISALEARSDEGLPSDNGGA